MFATQDIDSLVLASQSRFPAREVAEVEPIENQSLFRELVRFVRSIASAAT
jgi:hypothetical protein